ncbi:MAG: hypothetical protein MJZ15_06410 [Bacteroidales bacterium]|nr:hypothetical protein [Bacteroidales bacterium]
MKTISKHIALAVVAIMASSCNKTQMVTDINEDGTCHREIYVKTDSLTATGQQAIENNDNQAFRPDSTWKISCIANSTGKKYDYPITPELYAELNKQGVATDSDGDDVTTNTSAVSLVYSHDFNSVDEMCKAMPYFIKDDRIEVEGTLEKSYKWIIFTDYTYTETYRSTLPKFSIGIDKYMTQAEADIWATGKSTTTDENGNEITVNIFEGCSGMEIKKQLDKIEDKVDKWVSANFCFNGLTYIEEHYDEITDAPISAKEFSEKKMEIVDLASSVTDNDEKKLVQALAPVINIEPYLKYIERIEEHSSISYNIFTDHPFNYLNEINIEATVRMPGNIKSITNGNIKDNKGHYLVTGERIVPSDYTIMVTSRTINWWVIIIIVLVAIASTIGVRMAKKNN